MMAEAKKSGVTVALSNAVVSAVQEAANTGETLSHAASNTSSGRMQGLAGAAGALAAYNTYNKVSDILKDPKQVTGFSIDISLGSSKSSGSSHDESTTAVGSQVISAGSVNVTARNPDGKTNTNDQTANAGRIVIEGSQVIATEDINLNADRDITLLAAGNTREHSSQNQSSSASVGVGFALGGAANGFTINASASRAKGQANGESQSSTNTSLQAGGTLTFNSGGDTTFQGATASAEQVTGRVGGDLILTSLQDTSTYAEKQSSTGVGVSLCIPPICAGASTANVSVSKTNINSNYQSVGEQTAIRAGDGGFDIDVQGKTTLTGAQITSTQAAIDNNKNKFNSAGGIDMQDLQNSAQYDASSYSVSASVASDSRNQDGTPKLDAAGKPIQGKPQGSAGFGSDSGNASSTSTSGISGIAGDQTARTGDQETGLKPLFDAAKVKQEVQAQVAITSEFGKQAGKAVGDYASKQFKDLTSKANAETDPGKKAALQAEAAKWDEGGAYRVAMHAAIGGLTGGVAGAAGAGAASAAAPTIDQLQGQLKTVLKDAGLGDGAADVISSLAGGTTAAAIGAAASGGSVAGGATAFNADMNNRQLHPDQIKGIQKLSNDPKKQSQLTAALCVVQNCDINGLSGYDAKGQSIYEAGKQLQANDPELFKQLISEINGAGLLTGQFAYQPSGIDFAKDALGKKIADTGASINNAYDLATRKPDDLGNLLKGAVKGLANNVKDAPQYPLEGADEKQGAILGNTALVIGPTVSGTLNAMGRAWEAGKVLSASEITMSSGGNISAQQISRLATPAGLNAAEMNTLKNLDSLSSDAAGALREVVSNSYFERNGFKAMDGKCGSNCFDGVYIKGDQVIVNEVNLNP